jgi:hypothetical protein
VILRPVLFSFCLGISWALCRWFLLLGRVRVAFIERRLSCWFCLSYFIGNRKYSYWMSGIEGLARWCVDISLHLSYLGCINISLSTNWNGSSKCSKKTEIIKKQGKVANARSTISIRLFISVKRISNNSYSYCVWL